MIHTKLTDTLSDDADGCVGKLVRLGNNFLQSPLFIPSRSRRCKSYTSFYGLTLDGDLLPDAKDHKILMALLSVLDDASPIVTVSRRQVQSLQGRQGGLDTARKQRLIDALEMYCNLSLKGTVGVEGNEQRIDCGVIDWFDYIGGKIEVRFNSKFIKQARPGKEYTLIKMDHYNCQFSPI